MCSNLATSKYRFTSVRAQVFALVSSTTKTQHLRCQSALHAPSFSQYIYFILLSLFIIQSRCGPPACATTSHKKKPSSGAGNRNTGYRQEISPKFASRLIEKRLIRRACFKVASVLTYLQIRLAAGWQLKIPLPF